MYFNDNDRTLYRSLHSGLIYRTVKIGESDLHLGVPKKASAAVFARAESALRELRGPLEAYAGGHPEFVKALSPIPENDAMPYIVITMCKSAQKAGVGPMAAVAGAVNDILAKELLKLTDELILENGGDIFIKTRVERNILVYAGKSPLSGKLGIRLPPGTWGVCTSSGTVGHALSFGKADAALIITKPADVGDDVLDVLSITANAVPSVSPNTRTGLHSCGITAQSDAMATALGNRIKAYEDIEPALKWALSVDGVCGALAVMGGAFGAIGEIELINYNSQNL